MSCQCRCPAPVACQRSRSSIRYGVDDVWTCCWRSGVPPPPPPILFHRARLHGVRLHTRTQKVRASASLLVQGKWCPQGQYLWLCGCLLRQLLPLPEAYDRALSGKRDTVKSLKSAIRDAGLEDRNRIELQRAIQAHFRVRVGAGREKSRVIGIFVVLVFPCLYLTVANFTCILF